jgi:hypothetical protein
VSVETKAGSPATKCRGDRNLGRAPPSLRGHEREDRRGLATTEPGTLLGSRAVFRSLVATFLLVAALVVVFFTVRLLTGFVLSALLILLARVSLALIHEGLAYWIVATSYAGN